MKGDDDTRSTTHDMDWFHCVNADNGERYHANEVYTLPKRMPLLDGTVLFLVRSGKETPQDYFADKKRRFDLQFQFRLKEPLPKALWYGVELSQPLPCLGPFRQFVLRAVLRFVQLMNGPHSFFCDLQTMAFAVNRSMDRLVRSKNTRHHDKIPVLGEAVVESPASMAYRATHGTFDWNTNDTYTSACLSAYFDFFQWQVVNMPAVPSIDLRRLVGPQHFSFVMYCGKPGAEGTTKLLTLELSNARKVPLGPCAAKLQR